MTIHHTITISNTEAYLAALATAEHRALHSYFNQHVILDDDRHYLAFDEGDYNALPARLDQRIIETIPGGLSDEY